ncbi:hypothetical protein Afe04nite_22130 [Asanoa ferruginea]|nr:hypothetical protein Afe04nite_22130 [Asanoa ferruginea]
MFSNVDVAHRFCGAVADADTADTATMPLVTARAASSPPNARFNKGHSSIAGASRLDAALSTSTTDLPALNGRSPPPVDSSTYRVTRVTSRQVLSFSGVLVA